VLTRYGQDQLREQALYWSFLAQAYLRAGHRAEAAETLETVRAFASQTRSARVDERIAMLRSAIEAEVIAEVSG
jgi:predicted Zn-dependent protease